MGKHTQAIRRQFGEVLVLKDLAHIRPISRQTFTCSKSKIETLAQKVSNMFKVNNKAPTMTLILSTTSTYFTIFSRVYIIDFEQVNVYWL